MVPLLFISYSRIWPWNITQHIVDALLFSGSFIQLLQFLHPNSNWVYVIFITNLISSPKQLFSCGSFLILALFISYLILSCCPAMAESNLGHTQQWPSTCLFRSVGLVILTYTSSDYLFILIHVLHFLCVLLATHAVYTHEYLSWHVILVYVLLDILGSTHGIHLSIKLACDTHYTYDNWYTLACYLLWYLILCILLIQEIFDTWKHLIRTYIVCETKW